MDFAYHEHEELRQPVRRFMENESPEATVRKTMETETGYDRKTWERMAAELSLLGLIVPEQYGGAGLGPVELAIAMEEMGRVLFCGPYLSSAVLATGALLRADDEAVKKKLLPEIASGKAIATLAIADAAGRWDLDSIAMRAEQDGSAWKLSGVKDYVLDGDIADAILVAARADGALAIFLVEGAAAGMERKALPTLDLTRKLSRLTFSGTSAKRATTHEVTDALQHVLALYRDAGDRTGGRGAGMPRIADRICQDPAPPGRPIGSFQAIKHKCADMLVETEFARSAAIMPHSPRTMRTCSRPRIWPSPIVTRLIFMPQPRISKSTAAWALRGSIRRICISSVRAPARFCSAIRASIGWNSRTSWSYERDRGRAAGSSL